MLLSSWEENAQKKADQCRQNNWTNRIQGQDNSTLSEITLCLSLICGTPRFSWTYLGKCRVKTRQIFGDASAAFGNDTDVASTSMSKVQVEVREVDVLKENGSLIAQLRRLHLAAGTRLNCFNLNRKNKLISFFTTLDRPYPGHHCDNTSFERKKPGCVIISSITSLAANDWCPLIQTTTAFPCAHISLEKYIVAMSSRSKSMTCAVHHTQFDTNNVRKLSVYDGQAWWLIIWK